MTEQGLRPDTARRDLTRPDMLSAVQATLRRQALQAALAAIAAPPAALAPATAADAAPERDADPAPDPVMPAAGPAPPAITNARAETPHPETVIPETVMSVPNRTDPRDSEWQTAGQGGPRRGGWLRALARRGLRAVRGPLQPLLIRLEWRIRTAVEKSAFASGTTARLDELRRRAGEMEFRMDRLPERLDARTDALGHRIALDGVETRRLLAGDGADTRRRLAEAATAAAQAATEAAATATAEAAAYQAVLVGQLAETTRLLTALTRQHDGVAQAVAGLVTQGNHTQLVLELMRAETGQHDRAAAQRLDILLQRGVVPLGAGSAAEREDCLVRTPAGWLVVPGGDERLLMAMVEGGGVLERGTTAVLTALLRPGDTMVDVGAHIGTLTLPAARAVGPTGRVIAVEPGPRALAALRRSLHINSLAEHVDLHGCAAGAAAGEAVLRLSPVLGESTLGESTLGEAGTGDSGTEDSGTGENAALTVAVRPLDALVPDPAVRRRLRLVKIDAEGFELEVWKGMRRLLGETLDLAVIVEFGPSHLARAGIAEAAWFAALTAPGFAPWEIDEATAEIRPLRPPAERAGLFSTNLLLLRRPPEAYPGLRVAPEKAGEPERGGEPAGRTGAP